MTLLTISVASAAEVTFAAGYPLSQLSYRQGDLRFSANYAHFGSEGMGFGLGLAYLKAMPMTGEPNLQPYLGLGLDALMMPTMGTDVAALTIGVYPHALVGLKVPTSERVNLFGEGHAGYLLPLGGTGNFSVGARIGVGYSF
ncbi:hypothetical protein [Deinococcus fonticola]|uniref:hypothetical protein n=1 Tax=Deinococcus fonticola TaxID=2528713 RepID=UPI0010750E4F|nr:hypothetical protein [Deinococcus fonticola]